MSDEASRAESAPAIQHEFSWVDPHPVFVIVLVGPNEQPFGIQKNFLCAKSGYYRHHFAETDPDSIEHIVRLPDTGVEEFGYAQQYMFTGKVCSEPDKAPSYEVLIGVWKLGHQLEIDGLCDAALETMAACRSMTNHIPATPLLVQVWQDTPEGSSIRKLLLDWVAEYMRASPSCKEFARSLPQEVLSELVVAMSSFDTTTPTAPVPPTPLIADDRKRPAQCIEEEDDHDDQGHDVVVKRRRGSDAVPLASVPVATQKNVGRKSVAKRPTGKSTKNRRSNVPVTAEKREHTTEQKLKFCADILSRMTTGPGFWTRLVGPFKIPVDPDRDGVSDYLERIKKPMDLGTMKQKLDSGSYANEDEFLADMNQIFTNCYTYWTKNDSMYKLCVRFQKTFEEKYSQMERWIDQTEKRAK